MFSWIRHYVVEVCAPTSALLVLECDMTMQEQMQGIQQQDSGGGNNISGFKLYWSITTLKGKRSESWNQCVVSDYGFSLICMVGLDVGKQSPESGIVSMGVVGNNLSIHGLFSCSRMPKMQSLLNYEARLCWKQACTRCGDQKRLLAFELHHIKNL